MAAIAIMVIREGKVESGGGALECLDQVTLKILSEADGIEQDIEQDFEYSCLTQDIVSLRSIPVSLGK